MLANDLVIIDSTATEPDKFALFVEVITFSMTKELSGVELMITNDSDSSHTLGGSIGAVRSLLIIFNVIERPNIFTSSNLRFTSSAI